MLGQVSAVGKGRRPRAAIALVVVLLIAGCDSSSPAAHGTTVSVVESDFEISVPAHVKAGDVVFMVNNHGPDDHELLVVPAEDVDLPMRSDGLTVAEESYEPLVGVLEPGAPGSMRRLEVNLKPGRYVLFCNMSGHFLGGMHQIVVAQ